MFRLVRSRVVTLRNTCRLNARWSCAVRRHERPRHRTVHTREEDQWSEVVHHPGYSLSCSPSHGSLAANTSAYFTVSVFAGTWGLYYDQIIIMVEELEPLVIDVWVEAVGSPLSFALRTRDSQWPVLW
ncbi:unnamed protein product [Danaus chrysippus]|uniref:(African queen) hypothetical protein n=1 Tax=Danaus chrysippus TaxID=151541 RepID=A0A8J2VQU5_9NEOP|nr:unnamed protein product [Danaus chrysippus]